jgi:ribosomal-protein-serine acetyltransferase
MRPSPSHSVFEANFSRLSRVGQGMTVDKSINSLGEPAIFEPGPATVLKPVEPGDIGPVFALVDANRDYLRKWLPWLDDCRSADDTLTYVSAAIERRRAGIGADFLIEHERQLCGVISFYTIDRHYRSAMLGYWLAESFQGRGIMTLCVRRLVRHAFEDLNLNRLTIAVAVGNKRSRAIPQRLGFQPEGTLREAAWLYDHFVDQVLYAMIRSQWDACPSN